MLFLGGFLIPSVAQLLFGCQGAALPRETKFRYPSRPFKLLGAILELSSLYALLSTCAGMFLITLSVRGIQYLPSVSGTSAGPELFFTNSVQDALWFGISFGAFYGVLHSIVYLTLFGYNICDYETFREMFPGLGIVSAFL